MQLEAHIRERFRELPAKIQREYDPTKMRCMQKLIICFHGEKCYHDKFDHNCIAAKNAVNDSTRREGKE